MKKTFLEFKSESGHTQVLWKLIFFFFFFCLFLAMWLYDGLKLTLWTLTLDLLCPRRRLILDQGFRLCGWSRTVWCLTDRHCVRKRSIDSMTMSPSESGSSCSVDHWGSLATVHGTVNTIMALQTKIGIVKILRVSFWKGRLSCFFFTFWFVSFHFYICL